ncbi:MAG: head GIN domain-containing protein [Pedobacter sp.]|uniref:head GIN domain-containing protein n=1 Tax=Pedobacter sp. TaxID=1411316 RepID=UPI003399AC1B
MKRLHTLLFLTLMAFTCTAVAHSSESIKHVLQEKTVSNFKGIAAGGPLDIKVTLGNTESIRFEGDQEAIADLVTEVVSGILTVKPKTKWNDWSRRHRDAKVTVFINAKRISSLTMSGSGNLEVTNTVSGAELVATLSGSGSIKAAAYIKSFTGVLSGSGNINLSGKSDESNLTISGSGSFKGKSFAAAKVSVQISGSADVFIKATQSLDAVISGSGSVIYSGDAVVKKTIIGSGSVSRN